MIWKACQNHLKALGYISGLSYTVLIFLLTLLTGCPQRSPGSGQGAVANPNGSPTAGVPAPSWTQTEYVFHNKTNNQITILADQGDGRGISKVVLNTGECAYIEYLTSGLAYAKLIKAGIKKPLCGNPCSDPYKECKEEYEKCSDKLDASQTAGGYQNFKRNPNSQVGYLEIYNIVDANHLFETVGTPVPADKSQKDHWKEKCQSSTRGKGNPPQQVTNS